MKKTVLSLSKVFLLSAMTFALASCGGFFGVKITDQESIDNNLCRKIAEVIGEEAEIVEISLSAMGNFTETLDVANVTYFPAGEGEITAKVIYLSGSTEPRDWKVFFTHEKKTREDAQKLSEVDFSKIASYVNAAAELLNEEGYEFSGVAGYDIEPNNDPMKVVHEFRTESREGSKTTTKNGRLATETSYWEFKFKVDGEGNVEVVE